MRLARPLAALAAVALLGFAACGGGGDSGSPTAASEEPDPGSTTITLEDVDPADFATTTTTEPAVVGHAAAGRAVFLSAGCGGCHTLRAAGSTGTTGPNLDERAVIDAEEAGGDLLLHVQEAVASPDAVIAPGGYDAGVMPADYAEQLSAQQLADVVAFVVDAVQ